MSGNIKENCSKEETIILLVGSNFGPITSPEDLSCRLLGSDTIPITYSFVSKTKHVFSTKNMAIGKDMKAVERVYIMTHLKMHIMDSEITAAT